MYQMSFTAPPDANLLLIHRTAGIFVFTAPEIPSAAPRIPASPLRLLPGRRIFRSWGTAPAEWRGRI